MTLEPGSVRVSGRKGCDSMMARSRCEPEGDSYGVANLLRIPGRLTMFLLRVSAIVKEVQTALTIIIVLGGIGGALLSVKRWLGLE